jgi:hypothetical protein
MIMAPDRRTVLKSIGAAGAASVIATGTVVSTESECTETVAEISRSDATIPIVGGLTGAPNTPVVVGPGGGSLRYDTEPFTLESGVFEGAALDPSENRLKTVLTWNPVDQGPTECYLELRRQNLTGDFVVIDRQSSRSGPVTENRREMVTEDGGTFNVEAENETTEPRTNGVIIESGGTYRVAVWATTGPMDFELTVEAQAYDPECVSDSDGSDEAEE